MKYEIVFTPEAAAHLDGLTARNRARVLDEVLSLLENHPLTVSKNCRRMRENALAAWRLRIGELRVFFDIADDEKCVYIRAVGVKAGNKVSIGGELMGL